MKPYKEIIPDSWYNIICPKKPDVAEWTIAVELAHWQFTLLIISY